MVSRVEKSLAMCKNHTLVHNNASRNDISMQMLEIIIPRWLVYSNLKYKFCISATTTGPTENMKVYLGKLASPGCILALINALFILIG